MLVATVKPAEQVKIGGGGRRLQTEGAEQTGFVGLAARNSSLFMLFAVACASAWFFCERRRNLRKARSRKVA